MFVRERRFVVGIMEQCDCFLIYPVFFSHPSNQQFADDGFSPKRYGGKMPAALNPSKPFSVVI